MKASGRISRRDFCIASAAVLAVRPRKADACNGPLSVGKASSFAANSATVVSAAEVVVCRDNNGLYAMSSVCPHAGCSFTIKNTQLYCPCHALTYDMNGNYVSGPVVNNGNPLPHLALSVDAAGNTYVDGNTTTDQNKRAQ